MYTPILILFSLLQQENHGAQNLSYFSHITFIMLPLYLAKQTLMLYQRHYYVIIVFVYNLLHFNAFWPTVLLVVPLAQCVVCLSVCDVLYCGKTVRPS